MITHGHEQVVAAQRQPQELAPSPAVLELPTRNLTKALVGVVMATYLASTLGQVAVYFWGQQFTWLDSLAWWFLVVTEGNIPTWVSTLLLLVATMLLVVLALVTMSNRGRYSRHWTALALISLYLATDEILELHERTIEPLETLFGAQSIFSQWAIWGLAVAAIVGLIFLRFVLRLPPKTRALIVLAGAIYVSGAAGMELIGRAYAEGHSIMLVGGHYEDRYGQINLIYSLFGHIEELLEMLGVVVLIHALLLHLNSLTQELRIRLDGHTEESA